MAQGENRKQPNARDEEEAQPLNEQQVGAEFAKAFQELARGEQTAASLESRLDDIESTIERLLASAEDSARQAAEMRSSSSNANDNNNALDKSQSSSK